MLSAAARARVAGAHLAPSAGRCLFGMAPRLVASYLLFISINGVSFAKLEGTSHSLDSNSQDSAEKVTFGVTPASCLLSFDA